MKKKFREDLRPSLDLHGFTTDEVIDYLDSFIMKHQNKPELCIIVGKGKGLIKKKVIEYLEMGGYPWSYEKIYGQINEGALIVDLS
ncbi:MAG: Smr/MutS family protein [Bdellovibrionales bacterium]